MRDKKLLQTKRILAIGEAMLAAGVRPRDRPSVLGLRRSTAYHVMRGRHKHSGLSRKVVRAMLASRLLPPGVRAAIEEYVAGKRAGDYGHDPRRLRRIEEYRGEEE